MSGNLLLIGPPKLTSAARGQLQGQGLVVETSGLCRALRAEDHHAVARALCGAMNARPAAPPTLGQDVSETGRQGAPDLD